MIEIIPSILTNDPKELRELLERCEGIVQRVQVDIIDGVFADNKTIEPDILEDYEGELKFDFHLMVKEPVKWVEKCVRGQADRIIGQIELMSDQVEFLGKVQEVGAGAGLGLDLDTSIDKFDSTILTNLDVVLIMSVPAGFGGQTFNEKALKKISELNEVRSRDNTPFKIQDDGGISLSEINKTHFDGADEAAIGRVLFDGDLEGNIRKFQEAAHNLKE